MGFAVLADLKAQLNIPSADVSNDTELQVHLDASNEVAESLVGPSADTTFTELYETLDGRIIFLRRPLISVTSVTPLNGAVLGTALAATGYLVDKDRNMLAIISGAAGVYQVVYHAGWATVPARAKLGQLIVAQHFWRTQRGGMVPSVVSDETLTTIPGLGFAIPNRAAELFASLGGPAMVPGIA